MHRVDGGNTIVVTQGDSLNIPIFLEDQNLVLYELDKRDVLRFGLKRYYNDAQPCILKIITKEDPYLRLSAEETAQLKANTNYCYDLELTHSSGDVDTVINGGVFRVERQVI